MSALLEQMRALLASETPPYSAELIARVSGLLERTALNPAEWRAFANYRKQRYTRNIVAVDERFVALLLCWDASQRSAIHDHAGSSCWVKILDGELEEQRYELGEGGVVAKGGASRVAAGESSYMDDSVGVHHIANPSHETAAVSLHIYAPPFESCRVFRPTDGRAATSSMVAALAPEMEASAVSGCDAGLGTITLRELPALLESAAAGDAAEDDALVDADVQRLLSRVELTPKEWTEFASASCFSEHSYTRHLAHACARFSVVINCWNGGQRSLPHSHSSRKSWLRALHGELEVTSEGRTWRVAADCDGGGASFREDETLRASDRVLRNASTHGVAVSLHVYSPPLTNLWHQDKSRAPVVSHVGFEGGGSAASADAAAYPGNAIFTDLRGVARLVEREFDSGRSSPERAARLRTLLRNATLDEREWRRYAAWDDPGSFSRVLLAQTTSFNLVLTCWDRGHFSPVHDHDGSASWTKVLEGALDEALYELDPASRTIHLARSGTLGPDTVTYNGPNTIHGCENGTDTPSYTLTLYSPPYVRANAYTDQGRTIVEIPTHVWGDEDGKLIRPETTINAPDQ